MSNRPRMAVIAIFAVLLGVAVAACGSSSSSSSTPTGKIPLNILLEAALSFLGVGVRPPTASWGQMLSDASNYIGPPVSAWWYMVFPGAALLLTVLAFNLLGDGLLDALNPKADR